MADAITMERWRRQFDACGGRVAGKAQPLTGIDKALLEAQEEQESASVMWSELAALDEKSKK